MAIYLEQLDNLRPLIFGNSRDLEQFADILDKTSLTWKKMETVENWEKVHYILDYKQSCMS